MSQQQQQSETNVLAKIINNGSKTAQQVLKESRSRDDTLADVNFWRVNECVFSIIRLYQNIEI